MAKGELTDDERAELKELNVAIHMAKSKGARIAQARARLDDKSFGAGDPFGPNFALFWSAKLERKSLTGGDFRFVKPPSFA